MKVIRCVDDVGRAMLLGWASGASFLGLSCHVIVSPLLLVRDSGFVAVPAACFLRMISAASSFDLASSEPDF
jgi:hypothetical protein